MTRTYPLDGEILGPDDPTTLRGRERLDGKAKRVRKSFFKTVRKALGQIPFMEDVIAAYYCAFDPKTPVKVRATLLGALAYFVLPLDAVPDLILGVGFADDASVLMAAIALVTTSIREEHRVAARKVLAELRR